jgi:hypothetical protein
MYELMHASIVQNEREAHQNVQRELRHRRVWLWGVPRIREQGLAAPQERSEQPANEKSAPISRSRAVLNLFRLSIE